MNGFNEVFVDGHRHIASVQGSFQGRAIVSGLAEEFQLLVLTVQHGGGGVAHARKSIVEIFVGTFPQGPVGAFFQKHKCALAQGMLVPLAVYRIRKFQVGIRQSAVGSIRQLGHFPGGSQQLFLLGRQSVGLSPAQIGQIPAIPLQLRKIPIEAFQRLIGNGHDLRGVKAARGVQRHHRAHEFTLQGKALGISGILIQPAHTVVTQPIGLHVHLFHGMKITIQIFSALAQPSGKGGQNLLVLLQSIQFLEPGLLCWVQILQCPLGFLRQLPALRNFLGLFHKSAS